MLSHIISAILQVLVFTLVPFLVYVVQYKKARGFYDYIGLKISPGRANYLALLISLLFALPILLLTVLHPDFFEIITDPKSVTGQIRNLDFGVETVVIIVVIAVFKTSLAEEILFRGFLAKRIIVLTGYQKGNVLQAIIFGAIHTALFATISDNAYFLVVIFLFPALGAYASVYLNEKRADGSIIPGWIAHGTANLISYTVVGFLIG